LAGSPALICPSPFENMKTIAILGASADRAKFGNKAVRAFVRQDYVVYSVNPKETLIEGLKRSAAFMPLQYRFVSGRRRGMNVAFRKEFCRHV
jgi:CoA binding domain